MARFDVHRLADGGLVLDCQSDRFSDIGSRFVVPLAPEHEGPPRNPQLNPTFNVRGEELTMLTQLAASLRTSELRTLIGSLAGERDQIIRAIDVLVGSY